MSTTPSMPRRLLKALRAGSVSARAAFWSSFVAFFTISGLWAVSNPLMASIDEPSHMVKAVSVVLGAEDVSRDGAITGNGLVEIPEVYQDVARLALCLAFHSDTTASCQPAVSGDPDEVVQVMTSAINYNPLYYALVGLPVLLPGEGGEHTAYLMRLMSALMSSAVLALAVRTVAEMPRRRWLALGLLVPLTPTLVNLTGSINPQSFEVSGSVLLWVTLLALLREPDPAVLGRRVARLVIATTLVAHARGLGPFFVVLIVLLCVGTSPFANLSALLKQRAAQVGVILCVVVSALATAWIVSGNSLPDREIGSGISTRDTLLYTLGNTSAYLHQLVAMLGWDDVRFPSWFYMTYAVVVGLLVLLAWSWGSLRDRLGIAAIAVLIFVLPIAIQVAQAPTIGWFWQGRYIFPVAIGLSLVSALAIERRLGVLEDHGARSVVRSAAAILPVLQVVALAVNVHRYVNGIDGGWFSLDEHSWLPPVNLAVLAVTYTAAWAVFTVVVLRAAAPLTSDTAGPGASSPRRPAARVGHREDDTAVAG